MGTPEHTAGRRQIWLCHILRHLHKNTILRYDIVCQPHSNTATATASSSSLQDIFRPSYWYARHRETKSHFISSFTSKQSRISTSRLIRAYLLYDYASHNKSAEGKCHFSFHFVLPSAKILFFCSHPQSTANCLEHTHTTNTTLPTIYILHVYKHIHRSNHLLHRYPCYSYMCA